MNKSLYKFYDLENLTQEDLNKLALERNTYKIIIDKIKEIFKDYGNKEDISKITMYYILGESLIHILELLEEVE